MPWYWITAPSSTTTTAVLYYYSASTTMAITYSASSITSGGCWPYANAQQMYFYQQQAAVPSAYQQMALNQQCNNALNDDLALMMYAQQRQSQHQRQVDRMLALRAQERAVRRREAEMARHSEDARERARALLLRHLSEEQRESYLQYRSFVVVGASRTRYRVHDQGHMVGNIVVLDHENRPSHRLCGHCKSDIPMGDQLLAQKLMLEADEETFLRLANRHAA